MAEYILNGNYSVYIHINKTNSKKYVGLTMCKPEDRWRNGQGYRYNEHFWSAIQKYGWDGFEHEVIASNLTREEAENFEKLLILKLKTYMKENGYNNDMGGFSLGKTSEATRKKLSESHMGIPSSEHAKSIARKNCLDRWKSEEWKQHFSEIMKAHWADEAYREKIKRDPSKAATRCVGIICEGVYYKSVKDFSEAKGLNRYTVNNWMNGNNKMPLYWYEKGLRNQDEERNKKIRPRYKKGES